MDRYYRALQTAIAAHGGTVVKLLGDGVLAAFGVPRVAEDDALRAVRAAVAMQEAVGALIRDQTALVGDIGLRVAINTGEVVVSADHTDVVGDPVNVAARVHNQARSDRRAARPTARGRWADLASAARERDAHGRRRRPGGTPRRDRRAAVSDAPILDTHAWLWWLDGTGALTTRERRSGSMTTSSLMCSSPSTRSIPSAWLPRRWSGGNLVSDPNCGGARRRAERDPTDARSSSRPPRSPCERSIFSRDRRGTGSNCTSSECGRRRCSRRRESSRTGC